MDTAGIVTATGLGATRNMQLPLTSGTPRATSLHDHRVNLPSTADAAKTARSTARAIPGFDRLDPNSYNYSQQTTVYDSEGNARGHPLFRPHPLDRRGRPANTWDVHVFVGNEEARARPARRPDAAAADLRRRRHADLADLAVAFGNVFPSGASAPIGLTLDFGTATSQAAGTFTIASLDQDGFATGKLDDICISDEGLVTATFSDGTTQALGKLLSPISPIPRALKRGRRALGGHRRQRRRGHRQAGWTASAASSPARSSGPMSTSPRNWSR